MQFKLSTVIAALACAATTANALKLSIVKNITVSVTLGSVFSGTTSVVFVALNPVDFPITVTSVSAIATSKNVTYATFSTPLNLNIAAGGQATSPTIKNVKLNQGVFGSLGLLFQPTIDIAQANLTISAYNIPIELDNIQQAGVPLKVNLNLLSLSKRDQIAAREAWGGLSHVEFTE